MNGRDEELDGMLRAMLAPPPEASGDRAFARRIDSAIDLAARTQRARRRLIVDVLCDVAAVAALLVGLWRMSDIVLPDPMVSGAPLHLASPFAFVLLLWLVVQRRRMV